MENRLSETRKTRYDRMRKAQALVKAMMDCDLLPRLDGSVACVDCGEPAAVYDHRDYYKPMEVEPVCHRCNSRRGPGQTLPPEKR